MRRYVGVRYSGGRCQVADRKRRVDHQPHSLRVQGRRHLPFCGKAPQRKDVEESQVRSTSSSSRSRVAFDNRWMDLRAPANNAIMRIQSAVCQLFRELVRPRLCEIHTPNSLPVKVRAVRRLYHGLLLARPRVPVAAIVR
jgi:hypothetical protein